jgi:hypothetical protein
MYGEMRNALEILGGKPEREIPHGGLGVNGTVILKRMLKKGSNGRHL